MSDLQSLISVANGSIPARVLRNGRVVNVFTGEIERADVVIHGGRVAAVGTGYQSVESEELDGAFVAPGFIDAHVHIESSLCLPAAFADATVPRGVTTVVADPHEIANVCGEAGVCFMAAATDPARQDVRVMAPSCVPASHLATAGGTLDADAIARLFADGVVHGLGEMMNFPGVLSADAAVLAKIAAARGCRAPIDGHAPGVSASLINAYAAAGIGSDHECVTADEARDRLRRGMYLLIREATGACNLDALLPAVTPANSRRVCFCTDDRTPGDLLRKGSVDMMVRRAIAAGIEPVEAIRMATLNPSEWFGLRDVGAIAPGRWANLIVFDDLTSPTASRVYVRGRRVAENGRALTPAGATEVPEAVRGVCRVDLDRVRFAIPATGTRIRLIAAVPDQIVTRHVLEAANVVDGLSVADPARDIAKMAVLERHRGTGNVGLGFVRGTGLRRGAIAGTVAHDHHNLVVIGCDDVSMRTAAAAVVDASGGLAVAVNETVTAALPLPVAGLMSDAGVEQVAAGYDRVVAAAKQLGASAADPFMQMSFLALEVIPSLKLTDQGLVDVEKFERVSLFV